MSLDKLCYLFLILHSSAILKVEKDYIYIIERLLKELLILVAPA